MPIRGLRLFVRPIEAADHPALEAFFARQKEGLTPASEGQKEGLTPTSEGLTTRQRKGPEGQTHPRKEGLTPREMAEGLTPLREPPETEGLTPTREPAWGLLGKLLGDVVAVVALQLTDDALRVEDVTVARELRRKWIGRVMMREVEQLAVKMDRRRIVVEHAGDAHEFFRRVGFQSEGERWVRVVP